ncbi:hypothetical protein GIB67_042517 [Kingdonia uniflora]|uniref:Uncharacterized protein n=1 Tax=Kingdonia uniflora TaxID=39325 RepID=A0A7J7M1A3_9MAGN|nr:hypothetical protein GIB67_042517 [Kingdonia uniflora]
MILPSILQLITSRRIHYALVWTVILTVTVVLASFAPEMAFVSALYTSSSFSKACKADGYVRVPLDGSSQDLFCLPAQMFRRSKIDLVVPPVFAGLVVAGSACFVRAMSLWGGENR